jgi:hypothetical protein
VKPRNATPSKKSKPSTMKSPLIPSLLPMLAIVALGCGGPRESSDVVQVELRPFKPVVPSIYHETYCVDVKVAKGWYMYSPTQKAAASHGPGRVASLATKVQSFHIDGNAEPAWVRMVAYPIDTVSKDDRVAGGTVIAYEGSAQYLAWIPKEELQSAKELAVKIRVVASNGRTQLQESVVEATFTRPR